MEFQATGCRILGRALLVAWFACGAGCLATKVRWREPTASRPLTKPALRSERAAVDPRVLEAEQLYAAALESERECVDSCVDLFFQAAVLAETSHASGRGPDDIADHRLCEIYTSALTGLVRCGQHFGRLDARSHLTVMCDGQPRSIPVTHHGFVWDPQDFHFLAPVGDYTTNAFRVVHRTDGCGIPLVVSAPRNAGRAFLPAEPLFAATLFLRVGRMAEDASEMSGAGKWRDCALELYDPLRIDSVTIDDQSLPLAKDLSAPLAYRLRDQRRTILNDFFAPRSPEVESRLYALEPYQADKIPVVFIHGLLSDPFTWVEAVNELNATEGFVDNFQIWLFEYPTAQPFLVSAASLRERLAAATQTFDPDGLNPRFSEMVLVGHSMGGLISKLQVSSSSDALWRSIANRPIEQVAMQPEMRAKLTNAFFFEPSPQVSRVVFIGTPHQGSAQARRLVARVASSLVPELPQTQAAHRELIENNPGVFSKEFSRRLPTSIDLLEPNSGLLQALSALPIREDVTAHSIIGDAWWTVGYGASDGVVPVQSAREPQAVSERFVSTTHAKLDKHIESIDELRRILAEHLQSSPVISGP